MIVQSMRKVQGRQKRGEKEGGEKMWVVGLKMCRRREGKKEE